jgi:hypothetical protein
MPHINVEFVGREQIRAGIERLQGLWDYFMQTVHPGTIQLRATPRSAVPTSQSSGACATAAHT